MSDETDRDDATEVAAYREGIQAFFKTLSSKLTVKDVHALAGTNHEHHTLLLMEDQGERTPTSRSLECVVVRVKLHFGDVLKASDVASLIEAARANPGGVTRA